MTGRARRRWNWGLAYAVLRGRVVSVQHDLSYVYGGRESIRVELDFERGAGLRL